MCNNFIAVAIIKELYNITMITVHSYGDKFYGGAYVIYGDTSC